MIKLKNFEILTPHKEKTQIFPDFPDFWPKISRLVLNDIFSQLKVVGFQHIYICGTF